MVPLASPGIAKQASKTEDDSVLPIAAVACRLRDDHCMHAR